MDRLIEGYRRFRREVWPAERARYEALAHLGQKPRYLVLACSDSRVDPATVFGAAPGEIFVVRNVAGLAPTYLPDGAAHGTSAALEYGVRVLEVKRLVVLGHARCGGVQAMVEGVPDEAQDFVAPWVAAAAPALAAVGDAHPGPERLSRCEVEVVRLSLANLLTFPWVAERVADGRLGLAGFRFGIDKGLLERIEADRVEEVK